MNDEVKKVLFIVNRFAGRRFHSGIESDIGRACDQARLEWSVAFTEGPGHATELATTAVKERRVQSVFAAGGDGTINEVAKALVNEHVALGILPIGSGNGLARHLRIPLGSKRGLLRFDSNQILEMDAFRINGHLSLNVSGIGFDGHVAHLFGNGRQRGLTGYLRSVLRSYGTFPEFQAQIVGAPKGDLQHAFVIAFANSSQYGNNARIAPQASVVDGKVNVCVLRKIPLYRPDLALSFFLGTLHRTQFLTTFEAKRLLISLPDVMEWHLDGEPMAPQSRFEVEIIPRCLRVLVPAKTMHLL